MPRSDADRKNRAAAQARYRARQRYVDLARMNGWDPIEIAGLFRKKNGIHVAIDLDGKRIPLTPDPEFDNLPGSPADSSEPEKVDAPAPVDVVRYGRKGADREAWNLIVGKLKASGLSRSESLKRVEDILSKANESDAKRTQSVLDVLRETEDTPDWLDRLELS